MNTRFFETSTDRRASSPIIELEAHVRWRIGSQVRNLRLVLQDKGLVLTGSSLSYYAKQLAQHAVMEATEIPIARNEIAVVDALD